MIIHVSSKSLLHKPVCYEWVAIALTASSTFIPIVRTSGRGSSGRVGFGKWTRIRPFKWNARVGLANFWAASFPIRKRVTAYCLIAAMSPTAGDVSLSAMGPGPLLRFSDPGRSAWSPDGIPYLASLDLSSLA